ncbi:hypothetical protein Hypma_004649 [Hypsizygus marmoreus]|uniref:Uncharacterized protein n=1 Tax=Hypsizygus marmoreus TaxID=39966 RepID=A0A369J6N7_HYPMA|nr:hypothetical protein Hypma_004649 [Hypsizygus marmoreus]
MPRSCLDIVASISHVIASRVRVVRIATLLLPSFPFVDPPVKGHHPANTRPVHSPSPTLSRLNTALSALPQLSARHKSFFRTHFDTPHDGFEMIMSGITWG